MTHPYREPVAVVLGAARAFGPEIVARLRRDGFRTIAIAGGALDGIAGEDAIDVLVVNTPVQPRGSAFRDLTDDDFRDALDVQLYEPVAAGQWAAAHMDPGGSIVHVASKAHLGAWGGAQDIAAGASLVAMSRSMALELEALGIRINTVAPDFVGGIDDTPEMRSEVAATVAWLAGPHSAGVSGETILANRGRSLRMPQPRRTM